MIAISAMQGSGEVVSQQTLWDFLVAGGPVMVPIGLCSVLALALAMERYLRLRRAAVCPRHTGETLELLAAGRAAEARAAAEADRSPSGRILLAGVRRAGFSVEELERGMEDQGQKELERLQAPIRQISLIANVAPLLGLFGTVVGIYQAFHTMVTVGMGKPEFLAAGIEVALITTIAGLIVAIPAILVAAHLHSRVRRLMLHVDEKLAPAVELLARRGASDAA